MVRSEEGKVDYSKKLMLTRHQTSRHTLSPSHGRLKCPCVQGPNLLARHCLESPLQPSRKRHASSICLERVSLGNLCPSQLTTKSKDRVRLAINIVDLMSTYMELRRQGRGFVAVCPFHDDRRPSMQINPRSANMEMLGLRHRRRRF